MSNAEIAFIDLKSQHQLIKDKIDASINRVFEHGEYIMGKEVREFEEKLAEFCGVKFALTCGNGTDALQLVLMAEGIGSNDAVFVPSMTFVSTAEIIPLLGATPIFVDVLQDTFNMDPASLEAAIYTAKKRKLNPKAVIPVDLFGQPADYSNINKIAENHNLVVIADAAQALGGSLFENKVGGLATWTTTSFFPAKPLGCYGDGGAVFTNDKVRANLIKSLRVHGKGENKYDNVRLGINSRLDTIQAAILKEKLAIFPNELKARNIIASNYNNALGKVSKTPNIISGGYSSWAQYTIIVENRDTIMAKLKSVGIPSAIYYPIPLNKQSGYTDFPVVDGGTPVSDFLSENVLSLPMHPYLTENTQEFICEQVIKACS